MVRQLAEKVGLAPMEGVTDLTFRLWMAKVSSPAFCFTPFLRVTDSFPKQRLPESYAPELDRLHDKVAYKLIPQVMTTSAFDLVRTGKLLAGRAEFIDVNCGCPAPHSVGGGAGSSLLKSPDQLKQLLSQALEVLGPEKLSIKIRTGFDSHSELATILESVADLPLKRITIHGRTRQQKYDGLNRWPLINWASKQTNTPIYGSGDILSADWFERHQDLTEPLAGVLIGRGALRNPWIFAEIRNNSNQSVDKELMVTQLACLGLLYQCQYQDSSTILELADQGLFHSDRYDWQQLYNQLCLKAFQKTLLVTSLDLHRFSLGRVKMLWNYLRSSLPAPYFDPQILRSKDFANFASTVLSKPGSNLPIRYNSQHDWVYTSRKKQPVELNHLFH